MKSSGRQGAWGSRCDPTCGVAAVGRAGGAVIGSRVYLLFTFLPVGNSSVLIVISTLPKKCLHYVTMPFSSNKRATLSRGDWRPSLP